MTGGQDTGIAAASPSARQRRCGLPALRRIRRAMSGWRLETAR